MPRRVASRVRVLLTYDLYGGLSNQLYGHVDVLAMGLLAGAEVVLSPCAPSTKPRGRTYSKPVVP